MLNAERYHVNVAMLSLSVNILGVILLCFVTLNVIMLGVACLPF